MARTSYTKADIENTVFAFLDKFDEDKRALKVKLSEIGMPKGTYSRIINNQGINKKTLETIRAWIEGRQPKHRLVSGDHAYCSRCEEITPKTNMDDAWICKPCRAEMDKEYYKKNYSTLFQRRMAWRKRNHDYYVQYRRRAYRKKYYGKFAMCIELIEKIKKELVHVQNQK